MDEFTKERTRKKRDTVFEYGSGSVYRINHKSYGVDYYRYTDLTTMARTRVRLRFNTEEAAISHLELHAEAKRMPCKRSRDNRLHAAEARQWCKDSVTLRLQDSRKRAKKKGLSYNLSIEWLLNLLDAQDFKCSLTGAILRDSPEFSRNPWGMSIDRIDSSMGYTTDNCRVVCYAANAAMNEWGLDLFHELAHRYVSKAQKRVVNFQSNSALSHCF